MEEKLLLINVMVFIFFKRDFMFFVSTIREFIDDFLF